MSYVKILHIEGQVSHPVKRITRRVVMYWNWRGPYVDAFVGEAWRDSGALFFGFTQQDRELLHSGHGNISSVVARQKGLSLCQTTATYAVPHKLTLPFRSRKNTADAILEGRKDQIQDKVSATLSDHYVQGKGGGCDVAFPRACSYCDVANVNVRRNLPRRACGFRLV